MEASDFSLTELPNGVTTPHRNKDTSCLVVYKLNYKERAFVGVREKCTQYATKSLSVIPSKMLGNRQIISVHGSTILEFNEHL